MKKKMTLSKTKAAGAALVAVAILALLVKSNHNPTDITQNSVMITNKAMTHGGTGIIYTSSKEGSLVLTNDHVCRAIQKGGVVKSTTGNYQVISMLESQISDLCLVYVASDLGQNTRLADSEPNTFASAKVSGHPALMPTVISAGHFSDRAIIEVFTGMRPCTDEEAGSLETGLVCAFFGGIPVIKSYESILVTATIMPGSSGSGVYNSSNELSGVVFAGQGDFGYAWTVPYDQVLSFLTSEVHTGRFNLINQTVTILEKQEDSKKIREVLEKCKTATDDSIKDICNVIKKDAMWVK